MRPQSVQAIVHCSSDMTSRTLVFVLLLLVVESIAKLEVCGSEDSHQVAANASLLARLLGSQSFAAFICIRLCRCFLNSQIESTRPFYFLDRN